ncbi:DUF389 domain-containing protein [Spongiactinospora sp. TRM90649]|uniref:DUF389 domain-containing protein n=1 Tax=Spongiactinospora sp. TRM90649 TaxID=3031114 RepID=UPI0023FA2709|nr:DUF389 domain-containing protein [Spongiactinospora sp. TRM90649]MDF5751482.1 DUF389 domain-containing protein [Spongiactinospora sp. TRM90649]
MLHLRVISPPSHTTEAVAYLSDAPGVVNLVVMPGVASRPQGDVLLFDVTRETANDVIDRLKEMGLHKSGSIAAEKLDLVLSDAADRAEAEAPGQPDDAVVWEELAQRVADDSQMTWAYFAFFAIATQIAAIAVVINSPIVLVGAMVLGPEFGPISAVCFGLLRRDLRLIGRASRTVVAGFGVGIAVTFVCALVSYALDWIGPTSLDSHASVEFIVKPDRWSFIVALLAGAAGVLSITAAKSSALIGVFISVTTVPAAGYAALAIALGRWGDLGGSVAQVAINVTGMIISGTATLYAQRVLWARYGARYPTQLRRKLKDPHLSGG